MVIKRKTMEEGHARADCEVRTFIGVTNEGEERRQWSLELLFHFSNVPL